MSPPSPTSSPVALPRPPAHFSAHNHRQTVLYLGYVLALYLLPGIAAYTLAQSTLPWPAKGAAITLLTLLAAQGLFMLGVAGHEGFHYTLHRNRFVSAGLGMLVSCAVPLHTVLGFSINHWDHHRHTNTARDPDIPILLRYRHMLPRLLFARMYVNRRYLKLTLAALRGSPDIQSRTLGMTKRQLRALAIANLLLQLAWLAAYGLLIWVSPSAALYVFVLPVIVAIGLSGLNHYYEHEATTTHAYGKARSRTSWLHTVLMCGTNYHLEHHLYPNVPCWRLPGLHRWMREQRHYEGQPTIFEPRFLGSYLPIAPATEPEAALFRR